MQAFMIDIVQSFRMRFLPELYQNEGCLKKYQIFIDFPILYYYDVSIDTKEPSF